MAFDPCDVCGCVHANFASNESFKISVGRALCQIIALGGGGGGGGGPQVNAEVLCDDDGAGTITPFIRRITTDTLGVNTVADFELDGVTPYVTTGTVGNCCCECELLPTTVIGCYAIPEDTLVQTFSVSTGEDQIINPPLGATQVTVSAWGAGGGTRPEGLVVAGLTDSTGGLGGTGGFAEGTFVAQQLVLRVGDGGSHADLGGSFPGGGAGGTTVGGFAGASGGGYSGVFNTLLAPLVIAGGGGGAGGFSAAGASSNGGRGGPGGGTNGVDGTAGNGAGSDNFPGTGGTQLVGGTGGTADPSQVAEAGAAGASLQGGAGGPGNLHNGSANGSGGGGGGGGYFGGGGGAGMSNIPGEDCSGGGGGSGFVDPSATGALLIAGSLAGALGTVGNSGHALYNGTAGTVTAFSVAAAPSQDGQVSLTWAIGGPGVYGKALLWTSCDGTQREWRDALTGAVIDEADITACPPEEVIVPNTFETQILFDDNGAVSTAFFRHLVRDSAGNVTASDTTLDGTTPYVPTGTVRTSTESTISNQILILLDDIGASSVAFLRQVKIDSEGTTSVVDTQLDGTTPYAVVGTVKAGEFPPSHAEHILQDDNGCFLRRIQIDSEGTTVVSDWEFDGVTPWVTVGTVSQCCCPDPNPIAEIAFQELETLDYTALSGAYTLLLTPATDARYVEVINDTDAAIIVSFDGGTTDHLRLNAQEGRTFDFLIAKRVLIDEIHVKHGATVPLLGEVRATAYR